MNQKTTNISAHVAILGANLLFGVNYAASKFIIPNYLSPEAVCFSRVLFAAAFFWLLALFTKREKIQRQDWLRLALAGLTGVALNMYLFLEGIAYTSPIDSSIIMSMTPLLVLVLSAIFAHEAITKMKIWGIILGATGAITLILLGGDNTAQASNRALGNTISIASSLAYSIYLVLVKPLMARYSPLTVMRWAFTFATLYFLPLAWGNWNIGTFANLDLAAWSTLGFIVIGATCMTYALIAYGLSAVRPTTVSMYNYFQPVVAATLAVILGLGNLTWITFVCAALVFAGVYLVTKSRR